MWKRQPPHTATSGPQPFRSQPPECTLAAHKAASWEEKPPRPDPALQYHNLSGLKQHKLVLLRFWREEVQNQSLRAKIARLAGLVPAGSSPEGCFFDFSAAKGLPYSVARGGFLATLQPTHPLPSANLPPTSGFLLPLL